jgi:hypothetical protein
MSIGKYAFRGPDVADDIRSKYGFDGDLLTLFAANSGPLVHKWHHYIPIYDRYLSRFRGTAFRFLEIGVSKGGSLQLWRQYFGSDAVIFGIDIDPKCGRLDGKDAQVRIGSQDDPAFLRSVVQEMGGLDAVLDDGSHHMEHVRTSLTTLFPLLTSGGTYMIEDLHTAYWPYYGGGLASKRNFFAEVQPMIDDMHRWYHDAPVGSPGLGDVVTGIHVHDSIVVLDKGHVFAPVHSRIGSE